MKKLFSIIVSVLLMVNLVSAGFVGGGFNFASLTQPSNTYNKSITDDTNKENIIKVFKPVAIPEPTVSEEKIVEEKTALKSVTIDVQPEQKFDEVVPSPSASGKGNGNTVLAGGSGEETTAITQDHSVLVVGLQNGHTYAYDTNTWQQLWMDTSSHSGFITDVQFDGNDVYVAGADGKVTRHNSNTGANTFTYTISPGQAIYSFAIDSSYIYAGDSVGQLFKIQKSNGAQSWVRDVFTGSGDWDNAHSVKLMGGSIYVSGGTGYTYKYSTAGVNQGVVWTDTADAADGCYASKIYATEPLGSTLYIADSTNYNKVGGYCTSIATDVQIGKYSGTSMTGAAQSYIQDVAVDTSTNYIYTSNRAGEIDRWTTSAHSSTITAAAGQVQHTVAVSDNYVFAGSQDHKVRWYSKSSHVYVNELSFPDDVIHIGVEYSTVTANEPPEVTTLLPDKTVNEDSGTTTLFSNLNSYFSDFEGTTLTYTATTTAGLVTLSVSGATLSATTVSNANGYRDVTVTATDAGGATVSDVFGITVNSINDAPVYSPAMTNQNIDEEATSVSLFDLDSHFTDVDSTLTYSVSSSNTGLVTVTTDGSNNLIATAPTTDATGSATITVVANDGQYNAQGQFVINVGNVNDAPTVTQLPARTIAEDSQNNFLFNLNNYFNDPDGDALTYTASVVDTTLATVTIVGSQAYASTVTTNQNGNTAVTITAEDPSGETVPSTFTLTVQPMGDGPVLDTALPASSINEDQQNIVLFDLDNYFSDPDGDPLNFDAPSGYNTGLVTITINGNHEVVASGQLNQNGATDVTITAREGASTASGTFALTVNPGNDPPTVANNFPDVTVPEGSNGNDVFPNSVPYYFDDIDSTLTYNVVSGYDTGLITVTIVSDRVLIDAVNDVTGQTTVTISATDGEFTVQDSFLVTVVDANDAPVLDPIGALTAYVNTPFYFDVNATDVDGDTLTFFDNTPVFDIDSTTGVISFTPDQADVGAHSVTVTVSDGFLQDTEVFTLTVIDNESPDVTITYPVDSTFVNNGNLDVTWTSVATDITRYEINGTNVGLNTQYTVSLADGTYMYTVVAFDGDGNTGQDTVTFTVDTDSLTITITNPADNAFLNTSAVNVTWIGTDNNGIDHYDFTIAGGGTINVGLDTFRVLNLLEGQHTVIVTAYDVAGNTAQDNVNFTVDTIAPDVTITYPNNGDYISNGNVPFNMTWTSVATDINHYEVNGTDVGTNLYFTVNQPDGNYTYVVVAFDNADNTAQDMVSFQIGPEINVAPTVDTPLPNMNINEDSFNNFLFDLDNHISDSNGDVLTYTVESIGDPTLVAITIDGSNNVYADTVTGNATGASTVNISAYDGEFLVWDEFVVFVDPVNDAPIIILTANATTIVAGQTVQFDGSASYDVEDTTLTQYAWHYGEAPGPSGNIPTTTYTYNNPGVYQAMLTVTDSGGAPGTANVTITVLSSARDLTVSNVWIDTADGRPEIGELVTVSVNITNLGTADETNVIAVNLTGDATGQTTVVGLNGGETKTATFQYTWNTAGNKTFTATVNPGNVLFEQDYTNNNMTFNLAVNAPPVPVLTVPAQCYTNGPCDIFINGTDDNGIATYGLDFGDNTNTIGAWAGAQTITYYYNATGNYTVTLNVTDTDGATVTITAVPPVGANIINGTNTAPTAVIITNATFVEIGEAIMFDGSNSTDPEGIYSFDWAFGDGNTATGNTTVYSYPAAGLYTASLTVMDFEGLNDTATVLIVVHDPSNAQADLVAHDPGFWLSNYAPVIGTVINANMNVYNLGGANASNFTVGLNDTTGAYTEVFIANLANGTMQTVVIPWTAVGVNVTLTGTADIYNNVTESNENNNNATMVLIVGTNYNPTNPIVNPIGPVGPGGTNDNNPPVINPDPTNTTLPETPIFIDDLITYHVGDFIITRDYFYNPNTDLGWYTMDIVNVGEQDYVIILEDPNPYNAINDVPEDSTVGNRLVWELDMPIAGDFGVTYDFEGELTTSQVKTIGVPVIIDITPVPEEPNFGPPTPTPEPEEEEGASPLTGFLTLLQPDFWQGWTITLALLAMVIMISAAWILFKEQGYSISIGGAVAENKTFEELDFNQPSAYAEGTLY